MTDRRRLLLIAVIAFLAAIAGAFIGRAFIAAPAPVENELHSLLHHNLKLDRAQQTQMDEIERRFAISRQALELELRADNARLADAIHTEPAYGARKTVGQGTRKSVRLDLGGPRVFQKKKKKK